MSSTVEQALRLVELMTAEEVEFFSSSLAQRKAKRSTSTTPSPTGCSFFDKLPAELRNEIYELSFTSDTGAEDTVEVSEATPPSKNLLLTSRRFHHEAHRIYLEAYRKYWRSTNFKITLEVGETTDGEVFCERYTLSEDDFPDDIDHICRLTVKPRRDPQRADVIGDWQYCQYTFTASPPVWRSAYAGQPTTFLAATHKRGAPRVRFVEYAQLADASQSAANLDLSKQYQAEGIPSFPCLTELKPAKATSSMTGPLRHDRVC